MTMRKSVDGSVLLPWVIPNFKIVAHQLLQVFLLGGRLDLLRCEVPQIAVVSDDDEAMIEETVSPFVDCFDDGGHLFVKGGCTMCLWWEDTAEESNGAMLLL